MAYLPFEPSHVGELVYRTYIEPFENVTATTIALALKVDPEMFSNFIDGKIDLTTELAIKLSEVLGGFDFRLIFKKIMTVSPRINLKTSHSLGLPNK